MADRRLIACVVFFGLVSSMTGSASADLFLAIRNFDRVDVFADDASSDDSPIRSISGPVTTLLRPYGVAVDTKNGELLVVNEGADSILVFPIGADGDMAPLRTISGPATTLDNPVGIAVDTVNDEIFVANNSAFTVVVFPRTADGDVAPIRTIEGGATGLSYLRFVFLDLIHDELFVGHYANRISVFDRLADGNATPRRFIEGPSTGLMGPRGLFVDPVLDEIIVMDRDTDAIFVFARDASGDQAPLRTITGASTGLDDQRGLILTGANTIMVSPPTLTFDRNSDGDVPPLSLLDGGEARGITSSIAYLGAGNLAVEPEIFSDGFETGDTQAWDGCPAATHRCAEVPPIGWDGPAAVHMGDAGLPPQTCTGDYPDIGTVAFTDLNVPAASCDCQCDELTGAACSGTGTLNHYPYSGCAGPMSSWSVTGDCTSLGSPYPSGDYWTFDASTMTVSGGSCPASVIADIPGAFHETRVTPCDGAAAIAGCQNGFSCLPNPAAPFDSALCIWRVGDFACPAGSGYEQRSVYHTDFDDTRDCGVCTCESPAGDCIESWIELTDSPSCSSGTLLGVIFGNGFCVQGSLGPSAQAGAFNPVATGSCTPAGGGVVGSVVPTGPITVCCSTP